MGLLYVGAPVVDISLQLVMTEHTDNEGGFQFEGSDAFAQR